jgi:hypothetical protein
VGRPQVIQYLRHAAGSARIESVQIEARPDRLIATLELAPPELHEPPLEQQRHVAVLFVRDGRVAELQFVASPREASAATAAPPPAARSGRPTTLNSLAAVLSVRDLPRALEHYRLLGFSVSPYVGGGYGFAERDGVEMHFGVVPDLDPALTTSAVYLYVDDADALFAEWRSSGVSGQFLEPQDTEYGLREGAHIDLDGNLLRFGSPLQR